MTALVWDKVGERFYQTGVDHGVLYLPDGSGVPWNGLISLTEKPGSDVNVAYMDGVKYLETHIHADFAAELKAYTYPDEFDDINGIVFSDILSFHDQPPKTFGLSYRTMLGNDANGVSLGYKIHILYNLMVMPSDIPYESINNQISPIVFSWIISGTPVKIEGFKPTCHISIDSTKISAFNLSILENQLYGTSTTASSLPSPAELVALDDFIVTDNGDGTWTGVGLDHWITMLDDTTFQLNAVDSTVIDANTYTVSSTFT